MNIVEQIEEVIERLDVKGTSSVEFLSGRKSVLTNEGVSWIGAVADREASTPKMNPSQELAHAGN